MVHILFGTSLVVINIFDIPISMIIMALKDSIVKLIKKLYQNVFYVSTILLETIRKKTAGFLYVLDISYF